MAIEEQEVFVRAIDVLGNDNAEKWFNNWCIELEARPVDMNCTDNGRIVLMRFLHYLEITLQGHF